jgi:probable F420-dependent oxidoreductase
MDVLVTPPELRCGLVLAAQEGDAARRMAQRAEALGFDSLWAGDHVSFHVPIAESLTLLSFAAGATSRIALGTAVYLLPLRHPTLAAKITATLDRLAAGRLVLGVGVGGEYPPEFEAVGVPVAERGARTDESIPLLRRLWTEDRVVHEGRFFRFGPVTLAPKPVGRIGAGGAPPIWVGGRAPAAMRRAGRFGDGYISHMASAEHYRANLALIAQAARDAERKAVAFTPAAFLFTFLEDRFEDAHAKAAKLLGMVYARDFSEAARKYCLLGRPSDCLEQMRAFARAGCRHFILAPLSDAQEFAERAGAEILPEVSHLTR